MQKLIQLFQKLSYLFRQFPLGKFLNPPSQFTNPKSIYRRLAQLDLEFPTCKLNNSLILSLFITIIVVTRLWLTDYG